MSRSVVFIHGLWGHSVSRLLCHRAGAPAELRTYADRGHSAPFDSGWREIADDTLAWLESNGLTS